MSTSIDTNPSTTTYHDSSCSSTRNNSSISTTIQNNTSKRNIPKKRIIIYIFIFIFLINILIFFIIHKIIKLHKKENSSTSKDYRFVYKLIYYDINNNNNNNNVNNVNMNMMNNVVEVDDEREMIMRGYSFSDENGKGIVYPIRYFEGESDKEYKMEGECECCLECMEDSQCGDGDEGGGGNMYCVDNECVKCKNDGDCSSEENKVCINGNCREVGECRENNDCMGYELCNYDGMCIEGCRIDNNCEKNEICIRGECIDGCRDDRNCGNDYDNICIGNQCVNTENVKTCLDENDCDNDHYCDNEYFICINHNKRKTLANRRNQEIIPAVCSLYGVVSLFVMVASYSIAQNLADNKLQTECHQKCSELYYTFSETVNKVTVSQVTYNYGRPPSHSECTGSCRLNGKVLDVTIVDYGTNFCHTETHTEIITIHEKQDPITTQNIFKYRLRSFCRSFRQQYVYTFPQSGTQIVRTAGPCVADINTIRCRPLDQVDNVGENW